MDWPAFLQALRANRTVKHVCFSGTFVRELSEEQWRLLLEGVSFLHSLEELQIWCAIIPVATFGQLFQQAQKLSKVYLFQVRLSGTQEDFDDIWSPAIRQHSSLKEFRLGGIQLVISPSTQNTNALNLDIVVEALAASQNLKILSLQLTNSTLGVQAPFSADALKPLLRSTSITDLYLTRLGLMPEHFAAIAEAISLSASTCSLRVLDLFGNNNLTNDHFCLMAQALESNATLETFVLPRQHNESIELSKECSLAMAQALLVNKTLVTLSLPCSNLDDDGLLHLASSLTVNSTLKKIEVGVSKTVGEKGKAALTQMLEKNYELERLVISSAEKSFQEKVEYYIRLNAVGRGPLLQSCSSNRAEWVEMLISVHDDLNCLFYFITMNPTVCQYANASETDVIITEELEPVTPRRHSMLATTPHAQPVG